MADNLNQHFVPQFYFRQFNTGAKCIQKFMPARNRWVRNAPIKHECSSHKFYGDSNCEKVMSHLEGQQAPALKQLIIAAWSRIPIAELSPTLLYTVLETVMVQRARTRAYVKHVASSLEAMMLTEFRDHLATDPTILDREEILQAFDSGSPQIAFNEQALSMFNVGLALASTEILTDMEICLIRNRSRYPFVFSDVPVVFHNTIYQNVANRGVIGTDTPGLQIFVPLNSVTMAVLFDPDAYEDCIDEDGIVDVSSDSEISQLNALQIHSQDQALYFASDDSSEYLKRLWEAHGPSIKPKQRPIRFYEAIFPSDPEVDGVYHQFDPLLNIKLDLSFLKCSPIDADEYKFSRRNPLLSQKVSTRVDELLSERRVGPNEPPPIGLAERD